MNLAIFDRPINLNRYRRGKVLEKAFHSMPHICPSKNGENLSGFSLEQLQNANAIRIRLSLEKGKQPVIEGSFDQFVNKVGSTNGAEESSLTVKESLEKLRNPKSIIEFIIENIGEKSPKYKLKEVNHISTDTNNYKEIGDFSSLNTGDIVEIYKHNQAAVKKTPLSSREINIKSLLKEVIERLKGEKLNPKNQDYPMVAGFGRD